MSPTHADTHKTKQAGATPKAGEKFRCAKCGMAIEVTADCRCQDVEHVHFECCGQALQKM